MKASFITIVLGLCFAGCSGSSGVASAQAPLSASQKSDAADLLKSSDRLSQAILDGVTNRSKDQVSPSQDTVEVTMAEQIAANCLPSGNISALDVQASAVDGDGTDKDWVFSLSGSNCPILTSIETHIRGPGKVSTESGSFQVIDAKFRSANDVDQVFAKGNFTFTPVEAGTLTLQNLNMHAEETLHSQKWGSVPFTSDFQLNYQPLPKRGEDFTYSGSAHLHFQMPGYTVDAAMAVTQKCLATKEKTQFTINGQTVTQADFDALAPGWETPLNDASGPTDDDSVCDQPSNGSNTGPITITPPPAVTNVPDHIDISSLYSTYPLIVNTSSDPSKGADWSLMVSVGPATWSPLVAPEGLAFFESGSRRFVSPPLGNCVLLQNEQLGDAFSTILGHPSGQLFLQGHDAPGDTACADFFAALRNGITVEYADVPIDSSNNAKAKAVTVTIGPQKSESR